MQIMYIYDLQTSNYAYCHINPKKISYQALCLCQTYVTQTSGFVNKHANDFLYFLKRKCMHTRNDHLSPAKLVQLTNVTHVNGIYLTIRKNFLEHRAMMLINEKICLLSYCIRRRPFINCCGMDGMKKNQLDLLSYSVGKMPMNFFSLGQVQTKFDDMS